MNPSESVDELFDGLDFDIGMSWTVEQSPSESQQPQYEQRDWKAISSVRTDNTRVCERCIL